MDTRVEYIDKFLQILDWDVNNQKGKNIRLKEVKRDNLEKDGDDNTFPDYIFSLNSKKKFCLEAKKVSESPSVSDEEIANEQETLNKDELKRLRMDSLKKSLIE